MAVASRAALHCLGEGIEICFVPSTSISNGSNSQQLAHECFLYFSQSKFGSWQNYKRLMTTEWILGYNSNPNRYEMLCICPTFMMKMLCKHSLGFQIIKGNVVALIQAKIVPLGQKKEERETKEGIKCFCEGLKW